jgi:hypothetical protein
MAWHIKIGKLPWCRSPYVDRQDLSMVARDDGIVLACSHVDRAKAHRMIECLRRLGLDFARVVEGPCAECGGRAD